jgi:SAM-dependent methyltransferase
MKEYDIRPADLYHRYLELLEADAAVYFSTADREDLPCPACDSPGLEPAFEKSGFTMVACRNCGTLFQSPRPPREDFARFYQESPSAHYWAETFFPAVAEVRRRNLFQPKVEMIAQLCQEEGFWPQVLADIGAGYGIFLEEWRHKFPQTELIAIEPHPELAARCKENNFHVIECFAEDASEIHGCLDMVVAQEVIEHVHSPVDFCTSLWHLLRPGGRLVLTSLTVSGFDIQVLWEHCRSICPPVHLNFMSIDGFRHLLTRVGFRHIRIFTPGRLDVDIVRNVVADKPHILRGQRFIHHLLSQDENCLAEFQNFLSENRLSSHCWIWAEK